MPTISLIIFESIIFFARNEQLTFKALRRAARFLPYKISIISGRHGATSNLNPNNWSAAKPVVIGRVPNVLVFRAADAFLLMKFHLQISVLSVTAQLGQ